VGKNLPNVRHLPMQETFQRAGWSGVLMQGANNSNLWKCWMCS
jgi:hypothetical protein